LLRRGRPPLDKHPVRGSYINTDTNFPVRIFVVFLCSLRRMPNNTLNAASTTSHHILSETLITPSLDAVLGDESFVSQVKNE
jgi:hypothetical protein